MAQEYLNKRDIETRMKAERVLEELPSFVHDFYDAKAVSKKELTRHAYVRDIREFFWYLLGDNAFILASELDKSVSPSEITLDALSFVKPKIITEYMAFLADQGAKTSSIKRKVASLSTFFKWLYNNGDISSLPTATIEWPAADKSKSIIYLDAEETRKLLDGVLSNDKQIFYLDELGNRTESVSKDAVKRKEDGKGALKNKSGEYEIDDITAATRKRRERLVSRNYLIIALFLHTGIRVSELVSIDLEDIDFKRMMITITGKGGKTRPVGFGNELVVKAMSDYLNGSKGRKELVSRKNPTSALFVSSSGNRITVRMVETMIKEMVQTYLPDLMVKDDFSPHKLRSTCATRLLKQTGDIKKVSDLLGHDNISVTAAHYAALEKLQNAEDLQSFDIDEW